MPKLSDRGRRLIESPPLPEYIREHFQRAGEPWHRERNPNAYVSLCIAENKLHNDALNARLAEIDVPPRVLGYDAMHGNALFRERLARFMGRSFLGRTFSAEQIVVLAGAGTVLEMLCYAIASPGDGVLVPTPSYAGFWFDLETRDELKIVTADCSSNDGFKLSPAILSNTLASADCPVKALLFTTPNNPLGTVYSRDEIEAIVDWAAQHDIHLIIDEIYALSVFGTNDFISVAQTCPALGESIHIVWAFSKDFGASGLRCGVLISENTAVINAVSSLAYWAACSGHTQHLLSELINDDANVATFINESQAKLAAAYTRVIRALEANAIPYFAADAAFFLICDLRAYLDEASWPAERRLWRKILERANTNLTPGEACRINEPGFFRLCYAAETTDAVEAAIGRMSKVLSSLKGT
ncbi:MAG: aminotransferase class I/II-fold pyridoxal phosphate-dependent enzyme [Proteobacteria bacterium]|nr:aminotransferase class I/II-fold pyridoxal phosphate-dependent enzyme [Pseudomonadota bacterium]